MKRGEFSLATQVGSKGYFGKVALEVEHEDPSGTGKVEFDQPGAQNWQSGARFGIDHVLENIPKKTVFPKGGKIIVHSIQGHPVDTNNVVIAYVAAYALLSALEISLP